MTNSQTKTGGNGEFNKVAEFWEQEVLTFWLDFWRGAEPISGLQGKVLENWCKGVTQRLILAPLQLCQNILPGWEFGPQENVYVTNDWELEKNICEQAAGYGSQLGTIMDCLSVYRKSGVLHKEELSSKDKEALGKFDDLYAQIERLKKSSAKAAGKKLSTAAVNPVLGRNVRPTKFVKKPKTAGVR